MYNFDGQHKIGLKVSLGGASRKVDKLTLLSSAREERFKREANRRHNLAAIKLQAWFRGCHSRHCIAKQKRIEFDRLLDGIPTAPIENKSLMLKDLVQKLTFFYKLHIDFTRLVKLCQILLKLSSSKQLQTLFGQDLSGWTYRIKMILLLCCKSLCGPTENNISISLRMIEVFTEARTYEWNGEANSIAISTSVTVFLVQKGYFHYLREVINQRIPSSIEPSPVPPTPFARAAKDLVLRPIQIASKTSSSTPQNLHLVQTGLIRDILSVDMTEQICFFLIPAISTEIPFQSFMHSILQSSQNNSMWLFYSFLMISQIHIEKMSHHDMALFISCMRMLMKSLQHHKTSTRQSSSDKSYQSDSDDSDMEVDTEGFVKMTESQCTIFVREKCLEIINERSTTNGLLLILDKRNQFSESEFRNHIHAICETCHHMISQLHVPVHKSRLLYTLAFNKKLMTCCWNELKSLNCRNSTGKTVQLLHQLSYGFKMTREDENRLIPILNAFTVLFRYALFSIYDSDFYCDDPGKISSMMPFSLQEVVHMSRMLRDAALGVISLMFPDVKSISADVSNKWFPICQNIAQLLKQLYSRNTRHSYCPEEHWLSARAAVNHDNININSFLDGDDTSDERAKQTLSTINLRSLAILKYIPFAIPFIQRVRIFQRILSEDLKQSRDMEQSILPSHGLNISVNRKYLYQDAYDQLSQERTPDVRKVVRVHMINAQGLDEAGVDGGGVFREFMTQLLKTGFDPSYGFFKLTSQQLLFPNPDIGRLQPDYLKHMHFLGRMLGKIIYESMMVELPLAEFFLCKLLNKHGADVDIYQLESLDPELYKNLLSLKNYDGDVDELALNFTVIESDYGETRVEELKPGGKDICVTNSNRIEYIHLMADYRLNKQIRSHCNAFRAGLSDVINIEWLQMFDHSELQILISGAQVPVDIDDLRLHSNYSGSYTSDDPYMKDFWRILISLTDKQKRQFLKFVTSCSRPPLLGFSELYPQFCIHFGGDEDRLPTASTCMNFLKLPRYKTTELLKARLIYAIESEAGFELS